MKNLKWILVAVLVVAGGLGALLSLQKPGSRASSLEPEVTKPPEVEAPANGEKKQDTEKTASAETEMAKASTPLSQNPIFLPEEARQSVFAKYEYKEQIDQYSDLSKKVLRPEAESNWMKKVQEDGSFVNSLGDLLTTPATSDQEIAMQDAAIEVLIDSVKGNPQGPAAKVLNEVVSNKVVEDKSVPQVQRENLAGIKGEVMMKWISSVPKEEGQMAGRLPGPVSEKVWKNVLAVKDNNLKESQTLAK